MAVPADDVRVGFMDMDELFDVVDAEAGKG
jgi:hypothetical protein